jgi:transcriptional regulator GlxA family with amidase domain
MEQNVTDPLPIETIALKLRVSRRTLERRFRQHAGAAPRAIYLRLRLKHARILLRSKKRLSQIASETGFSGVGQLTSALRREFGSDSLSERSTSEENRTLATGSA